MLLNHVLMSLFNVYVGNCLMDKLLEIKNNRDLLKLLCSLVLLHKKVEISL